MKLGHYINGAHVADAESRRHVVWNPATGESRAEVALASAERTREAIAAAAAAAPGWAAMPALRRARVMFRFKELCVARADEICAAISDEHGKVLADARGELTRGLEVVEFACGIPHLQKGEHSANVGTGVDSWSLMQPLGVVAGITPFNFPVMVPMWMFPIALACGNTFVLKPSEKDPSAPLLLADLLAEAGAPPGVFNVVNGDKEAVDTLLDAPEVQAVSFVGSTPIAEYIYERGCAAGKRVQALGGAKNHLVVAPDADIDMVASALTGAAYGSAGERCMAISVAVCVGDAVADAVIDKLRPMVESLVIGDARHPGAEMGPLVTAEHLDRVRAYVDDGVAAGAELVVDGRGRPDGCPDGGYFMGGCLFDRVTPDMRIYREEIFGPVLCVVRVDNYETACRLVDEHEFGNGTTLFTRSGALARHFVEHIQVGMVGINVPIPVPMAFFSFGGWKRSVFGPLNVHGRDGVRFYTRMKTITARWPDALASEFTIPTLG